MFIESLTVAAGFLAVSSAAALPKLLQTRATSPLQHPITHIELGPRPQYLVQTLDESPLKDKLSGCLEMSMKPTKFSIAHRGGGCLQFPEETVESIMAGTRMGAGIQECDVAFTKDRQFVCRHDQCDLHTTTNIVATELGAKCTQPFTPATNGTAASAKCCTSDITLAEFKTLCGKMDGANSSATTPEDYLNGTPDWRTNLYSTCGTVLTHKEFIQMVDPLGLDMTPELKAPAVEMPFEGDYTFEKYAQQLVDEYRELGINFSRVWPQSFQFAAVEYWLKNEPEFAKQALMLDNAADTQPLSVAIANLAKYKEAGVQLMAPPLPYLVQLNDEGEIVPSDYANEANRLGFKIVTWSLDRSPPMARVANGPDYYYSSIYNATKNDGDIYKLVDVLAREVGVVGIFSDWSSTVTYYANCMDMFP